MGTSKYPHGIDEELQGVLGNVPKHEEVVDRPADENSVYGPYQAAARNAHLISSIRRSSKFRATSPHHAPDQSDSSHQPEPEMELAASRRSRILGDDSHVLLDSRLPSPPSINTTLRQRIRNTFFVPSMWHTVLFLIIFGILAGSILFTIDLIVDSFAQAHLKFIALGQDLATQTFLYFLFQTFLVILSVAITQRISPTAAGSGIPEVKSILSGVQLPSFLSPSSLFGTAFALTLILGSGLFIGKEGPFVHISCALAECLIRLKPFRYLRTSSTLYRQIMAAAVAVGIASTFGAPIGGVLFSIEVTSTFFLTSHYPKYFLAVVVSAVWIRQCSTYAGKGDEFSSLFYTDFGRVNFNRLELFAFAVLGAVCGVVGSAFVGLIKRIAIFRRNHPRLLGRSRYRYSILVCLVTALLFYPTGQHMRQGMKSSLHDFFLNSPLSPTSSPPPNANDWQRSHPCARQTNTHVLNTQYFMLYFKQITRSVDEPCAVCCDQDARVLSGRVLPCPHRSLHSRFHFGYFLFSIFYFSMHYRILESAFGHGFICEINGFLMKCGFYLGCTGAGVGRFMGELMCLMFPNGAGSGNRILAGGYAVVGAAALSTGTTRSISTALIVFELTGELHHILPALVAVLVALTVANSINLSIYDTIIELRELPCLRAPSNPANYTLVASQVMQTDFPFIFNRISPEKLALILRSWPTADVFPLVDSEESMMLIGCVRRKGLDYLLRRQVIEFVVSQRQLDRNTDGKQILEAWEKAQSQGKETNFLQLMMNQSLSPEAQDLLATVATVDSSSSKTHGHTPHPTDPSPMSTFHPTHTALTHTSSATTSSTIAATIAAATTATTSPEVLSSLEAERRLDMNNIADRVIKMRIQGELNFHHQSISWLVDASPYQVVEETSLGKVYNMLTMLGVNRIYVTRLGVLVGEITSEHLLDQNL
eukprot:c6054_g1_i1.p1 GENE.c6054_g1_i1~~c6054_g1_i1.p1  ORF type:complete len:934 (-),score=190.31 c6054_g1_i1:164-2965(-)